MNHDDHVAPDPARGRGRRAALARARGRERGVHPGARRRPRTRRATSSRSIATRRPRAGGRVEPHRFPATAVEVVAARPRHRAPAGPFDGVLAANSLHFVADRSRSCGVPRLDRPGGRLVVVEYDADRGNPWVPHPFSFETWRTEAVPGGYAEPRILGRVPSRVPGRHLRGAQRGDGRAGWLGPADRPHPTQPPPRQDEEVDHDARDLAIPAEPRVDRVPAIASTRSRSRSRLRPRR